MILVLNTLFAMEFLKGSIDMAVFTKHVLSLGGSNAFIGVLGTCVAFIGFIWKPIAGQMSDSKGATRVLPWCLFTNAFGAMLIGYATSLNLICLGKVLCVFGSCVPSLLNTVLTTLKKEDRTKVLNKMNISAGLAIMSGGLTGGYISDFGVIYAYLFTSTLCYLSIILTRQLPETGPSKKEDETAQNKGFQEHMKSTLNNLRNIITSDRYWDVFAIKGCLEMIYSLLQKSIVYLWIVLHHLSGKQMGLTLAFSSSFGMITNLAMIKLNKIIYPSDDSFVKLKHGSLLMTLSFMGFYLTTNFKLHIFFGITASMSRAIMEPAIMGLMLEKVEGSNKGVVMSSFDSLRSLIEICSPLLMGVLVEVLGPQGVFLFSAFLAIVVLSISILRKH
nr:uncharacterized protein LOC111503995 isoform X1 [Leptinotarsa decemlineata]